MTTKLLLFDVDGTLLLSGYAGMRAMEKVFMRLYNLPEAFLGVVPDGKVDPAIWREIIAHRGLDVGDLEPAIANLNEKYIEQLAKEMPTAPAKIMPGVVNLLNALRAREDVQLALLTGNLEPGARIKCGRFELNSYFPFGAFGSDNEIRAELVKIAVKRAEEYMGKAIPMDENVFVIGDTPKDVECGKANGVTTVGVATANYTVPQLLETGADFVFDDFSDTEEVVKTLLG
jgi:phosphoglycolate phosphatase-like HAD superfamily hydrolase